MHDENHTEAWEPQPERVARELVRASGPLLGLRRASARTELAQIEAGVLHPLDDLGQSRDPRTAPVRLAHGAPGPAHEGINKLVRDVGLAQAVPE
jgi:hypothetical protein